MSFGLSFEEFRDLASKQGIVTNYRQLTDDLDTPVSAYFKLRQKSKDAFLFESVIGGENIGRYSFVGYRPLLKIQTSNQDPYINLEEQLKVINQSSKQISETLPFFHQGFVGYFSFETIKYIEPSIHTKDSVYPESYLLLVGSMIVFDHVMHKIYLISNTNVSDQTDLQLAFEESQLVLDELEEQLERNHGLSHIEIPASSNPDKSQFISNVGSDGYMQMVSQAKVSIMEGDIFQVVPSHKFRKATRIDPLKAYRILRTLNPSPYLFLFNCNPDGANPFSLVGSSPEMLVKSSYREDLEHGKYIEAEIRPIAGTYKRGSSDKEDIELSEKLLRDSKEIAEHVMLIDLARNDLGRVCQNSSVKVPQNMAVEKYSHVLHIVSSVTGRIKKDLGYLSGIELLKTCFPAGTLSGAPKIEAMKIITQLESEPRGLYGGGIGYLSLDGTIDIAIMIRTMLIESKQVTLQAGGGVVADSDPSKELQETYNKAAALMQVVDLAEESSS